MATKLFQKVTLFYSSCCLVQFPWRKPANVLKRCRIQVSSLSISECSGYDTDTFGNGVFNMTIGDISLASDDYVLVLTNSFNSVPRVTSLII